MFESEEEIGDLSGTRLSSYFPSLDDRSNFQPPSRKASIVGHDYYGLVPSLETSTAQPLSGVSHYLSFEPTNRATDADYLLNCPSGLLCVSPHYNLSSGTSLQGQASSQSPQHTDLGDSGDTSSQEFSAAPNPKGKDSPNNAALLYDLNSTDFTDSLIAQSSEPSSASQSFNNDINRAEIARAENLDLGYEETTSPPPIVRKQGLFSCLNCGKSYSHRHELK